jgi:hypothetical protein
LLHTGDDVAEIGTNLRAEEAHRRNSPRGTSKHQRCDGDRAQGGPVQGEENRTNVILGQVGWRQRQMDGRCHHHSESGQSHSRCAVQVGAPHAYGCRKASTGANLEGDKQRSDDNRKIEERHHGTRVITAHHQVIHVYL